MSSIMPTAEAMQKLAQAPETGKVVMLNLLKFKPGAGAASYNEYGRHVAKILDKIGGPPPRDIGYDLLPRLVGRAKAMPVEGYFRDVGTIDDYRRAREEWPARAER